MCQQCLTVVLLPLVSADVLKFDNSYSWTRAKEVLYTVKILLPSTGITDPPDTVDEEFFDCSDDITQAAESVS